MVLVLLHSLKMPLDPYSFLDDYRACDGFYFASQKHKPAKVYNFIGFNGKAHFKIFPILNL